MLQLYIAPEEDADAIAAGEYVARKGASLHVPDDLGVDDLGIGDIVALDCLLLERNIDPEHYILESEPLAEAEDAVVYQAMPEFVERLSTLAADDDRLAVRRWVEFLNGGEDEEGAWKLDKVQHVIEHLGALARRARKRELPVLIRLENF